MLTPWITVYHASHSLDHLERAKFDMSMASDGSLFGRAIYFSSSGNIRSSMFGKYLCKFKIRLDKPVLDMNTEITNQEAYTLLDRFNKQFNTNIQVDFDTNYDGMMYGWFFEELNGRDWEHTPRYFEFIRALGFQSFMYCQDGLTDFVDTCGDYGRVYGLYNTKNIKFIDGPF